MPIVIEYLPSGQIIGGLFYSYIPDGAVESGEWLVVIPGAVYGRMAHTVGAPMLAPGYFGTFGNGHRAGMAGWHQFQAAVGGEAGVMLPGWVSGQQGPSAEPRDLPQAPLEDRERTRSPSPTPARSPKRRCLGPGPSLEVKLPIAVRVDETSGIVSIANTPNSDKRVTQRATQIPHVGPAFRYRRGLLLRADSPYICQLCGEAFQHPADVKAHFNGHRDAPGRGCWEKHGSRAGVAWNDHESCKLSEDEVNSVRCKEGWVIVDQESWDRINAAADSGRAFKAEREATKIAGETGEEAKEVDGVDGESNEKGVKTTQRKESVGRKKSAGRKDSAKGKESAERKELPETKEAPKRKVVRAGDETETEVGARKR